MIIKQTKCTMNTCSVLQLTHSSGYDGILSGWHFAACVFASRFWIADILVIIFFPLRRVNAVNRIFVPIICGILKYKRFCFFITALNEYLNTYRDRKSGRSIKTNEVTQFKFSSIYFYRFRLFHRLLASFYCEL